MDWLSRLLVCAMCAAGISAALVFGCRATPVTSADGGSCSQEQIGPAVPADADRADVPAVRFVPAVAAATLLAYPTLSAVFPPSRRDRSKGNPAPAFLIMRD
jgi:hypothetical protein